MSANLAMLASYSDAMFAGDQEAVFAYWAPEFHSHVTDRVAPDKDVNLIIESDDLVVSNWTVKGTHTGTAFYDVPASGKPVEINGTAILRIRDGRIVEHWGGPHCQLGVGLTR